MRVTFEPEELATAGDLAACRELIRGGSRTFFAASHLLPWQVSGPAIALYAFCRQSDDAVDREPDPEASLARLRLRLDHLYEGRPEPIPADRAFADVVRRHEIPQAIPAALLEGFGWDAAGRRYGTVEELASYAARVAGSVGVMMTLIMGNREPQTLARAAELGMAMQFSNIARDVGEDAANGRIYLPLEWMALEGLDAARWLERPTFNAALGRVVARLLRAADDLYRSAEPGVSRLPRSCRAAIRAASLLYADIGREVDRRDFDSVSRRAVVPAGRKLLQIARSLTTAPSAPARYDAKPHPAAGFLVDAVRAAEPLRLRGSQPPAVPAGWGGSVARVVELFERLERRERPMTLSGAGATSAAAGGRIRHTGPG
jgi:phytoene synthase